jgi:hypothetical protein
VETAVYSVTKKPSWGLPNVGVKGIMLETIGKSDQRRRNETKHKEIEVTREKRSVTGHGVWMVGGMCLVSSYVGRRAESVSWLPRAPGSERQGD